MSSTMTATHFPEDVFSLIKSFTKPKVVCSCCAYDDLGSKYIVREGDVICEDCDEKYCCEGCEKCDMENDMCEECGDLTCDDVECSLSCDFCGKFICNGCVSCADDNYLCGDCLEKHQEE